MFKKLSKREQYAVALAGAAICLFIFLQFIVFPLTDKRDRNANALEAKRQLLDDMIRMKGEYENLNQKASLAKRRFTGRKPGFTLFSFMDEMAGKAGIKDKITYMKPSSSTQKNSPVKISQVELKLQAVTLKQITAYLHMVETSRNMIFVRRLSISKPGKTDGVINVVLQVETFDA